MRSHTPEIVRSEDVSCLLTAPSPRMQSHSSFGLTRARELVTTLRESLPWRLQWTLGGDSPEEIAELRWALEHGAELVVRVEHLEDTPRCFGCQQFLAELGDLDDAATLRIVHEAGPTLANAALALMDLAPVELLCRLPGEKLGRGAASFLREVAWHWLSLLEGSTGTRTWVATTSISWDRLRSLPMTPPDGRELPGVWLLDDGDRTERPFGQHPEVQPAAFRDVFSEIVEDDRYYDYEASVAEVERRFAGTREPKRVLEIGCGTGRLIVPIAELPGIAAHAVDVDPEMIAAAQELAASRGRRIALEVASATDYSPVEGDFDAVLFHGAALSAVRIPDGEYVIDASSADERRAVIEHAASSLAPGGSLGILVESDRTLEIELSGGRRYVRAVESTGNPARRRHSVYKGDERLTELQIVRERCHLAVFEGELRAAGLELEPPHPDGAFLWSRLARTIPGAPRPRRPFDDSGRTPAGQMRELRTYLIAARKRHRASGNPLIDLAVGDPRVDPFPPAQARAIAMLGSEKIVLYPNPVGEDRGDLVPFVTDLGLIAPDGAEADAHVLPCIATTQGFDLWAQSHLDRSDVILFPRPSFTYLTIQAEDAGATVEFLDLDPADGYAVTAAAFRARIEQLAGVGRRVTALYVASPDNPTGSVLPEWEAAAIAALAEELDLLLLHDAAYFGTEYDGKRAAFPARFAPDRTVTLFSLSKAFGFAGLRTGFAAGPTTSICKMAELLEDKVDSISMVAQEALRTCFSMEPEIRQRRETFLLENAHRHSLRGALTRALVNGRDPRPLPPGRSEWIRARVLEIADEGTAGRLLGGVPGMSVLSSERASFVLLADVEPLIQRLPEIGSSAELVAFLLETANVRLMPGEGFHTPGTVRISFSPSTQEIVEGFAAIHRALDNAGPAGG